MPLVHGVCHASRCCSSPAQAVPCQQGVQVPMEAPELLAGAKPAYRVVALSFLLGLCVHVGLLRAAG